MKIRTIRQTVQELKRVDPKTAVSENFLRQAVLRGDIPSRRAGNRFLIDLEDVEKYFSEGSA